MVAWIPFLGSKLRTEVAEAREERRKSFEAKVRLRAEVKEEAAEKLDGE